MGEEGMNPKARRGKEAYLKTQFGEMKRAFEVEKARRQRESGAGLGSWQPARAQQRPPAAWTEDYGGGIRGGYTNFETPPAQTRQRMPLENWAAVKVLAGSGLPTRDLPPWDEENVICFSGRDHWLSNFHRDAPVHIDDHSYPTLEHYYQACKLYMLGGASYSAQIRRIPDAGSVHSVTKRILSQIVPRAEIEAWRVREGPRLLEYALMHKFLQSRDLRAQLLATGTAVLAHTYERDPIFAVAMNKDDFLAWVRKHAGESQELPNALSLATLPYFPMMGAGKNLLGFIAMRVRDSIRGNLSRIEAMEAAVEEAGADAAKRRLLAANVTEDVGGRDPVLARAIASLASAPKLDSDLLRKIRDLKIAKDAERAERFAKREEARRATKAAAPNDPKDQPKEDIPVSKNAEEKEQKSDEKKEEKKK